MEQESFERHCKPAGYGFCKVHRVRRSDCRRSWRADKQVLDEPVSERSRLSDTAAKFRAKDFAGSCLPATSVSVSGAEPNNATTAIAASNPNIRLPPLFF